MSDRPSSSSAGSGCGRGAVGWRFWVDTGGTFTDCVALDPEGRAHRVKALSSGSLRANVAERLSARILRLECDWMPRALALGGCAAQRADDGSSLGTCRRWRPEENIVELAGPAAGDVEAGTLLEFATGEPAPVLAARLASGVPFPRPVEGARMRLATTRGTNALLERTLAPVAFFVTEGFADLLEIGDQRRSDLFARAIIKPMMLYTRVFEIPERLDAAGNVVRELDEAAVQRSAREALEAGCRVAAVALLHSWRNDAHEQRVENLLRDLGFEHVSASSSLRAEAKILPRARTSVVNAGLAPVVGSYLDEVQGALRSGSLRVMTSAGGLTPAESFQPADGLLSGPAGGVVGAAAAGRRSGAERIIAFDMGGTSTDVSRIDGEPEHTFEHTVGGAQLLAPALRIETVAAGGGSICGFHNGAPFVGPRSAGARPGPACYGAGGPLTITDVNLLLGRLDPSRFGVPVSEAAAQRAFDAALRSAPERIEGDGARCAALQGFLDLANEHMAEAIRRISVRRGYDPSDHALVAFGGAGPQHACAVASLLGCRRILVPRDASLLSAAGLGAAALERFANEMALEALPDDESPVRRKLDALERRARAALRDDGAPDVGVTIAQRLVELRLAGQAHTISVDERRLGASERLRDAFARRHRDMFGFMPDDTALEVVSLRVAARWREEDENAVGAAMSDRGASATRERRMSRAWFDGAWRDIPIVDRGSLDNGERLDGPALIVEPHSVTVVETGWRATVDEAGALDLSRSGRLSKRAASRPASIRAELLAHRLSSIAEQMGAALQRAALSTNVKERLDFSCAVLNPKGEVVASAPHIPVHLGAMGACAQRVLETLDLDAGDAAVTNHPAFGGSHLPDVTVLAPAHDDRGGLIGYVASRAHHAEIGGTRPGSMPPDARTLAEEGVVIPPMHLVRAGEARWDEMEALLTGAPHPTRAVRENLSDLAAAVAAGRFAADALATLALRESADAIHEAMERMVERSAERVRAALRDLTPRKALVRERMDDGSTLAAALRIDGERLRIDFTGTSPTHPGNFNAPLAVVRSVAAYVMRLLIDEPLPLNDGLLRPVEIIAPACMLNPSFDDDPQRCPAVAAGNVETSQRLTCGLLRALEVCADAQGTMNNVLIGDATFAHYETLAGGAGATADRPGADAVHTHMTNTAITDPEIFEIRHPVRIERTAIRRGAGGGGAQRGGDGLIRELTFLAPLELSVVTQHRTDGPRGMHGGGDGAPGAQRVIRSDGSAVELGSSDGMSVDAGDRFIIETPGGGGWGRRG